MTLVKPENLSPDGRKQLEQLRAKKHEQSVRLSRKPKNYSIRRAALGTVPIVGYLLAWQVMDWMANASDVPVKGSAWYQSEAPALLCLASSTLIAVQIPRTHRWPRWLTSLLVTTMLTGASFTLILFLEFMRYFTF